MWISKEVIIYMSIILAATSESRPISLHNYAPSHEYKSTDYSFSYGVKDPHTGDVKNQWEEKKDNVVRGEYFLVEPDGSTRTVQYTADDKNGFNAVVKYDQHSVHPITEPKEALSHSSLKLNPIKETANFYSSYSNKIEDANPLSNSELQTFVQHEYSFPESYSEIQNQASQNFKASSENQQAMNEQQHDEEVKYVYIPQKEVTAENKKLESAQTQSVREKLVDNSYVFETNQEDAKQHDAEKHELPKEEVEQIDVEYEQNNDNGKYTLTNFQTHLPLNLNILPDSTNKIPVDISLLNPIDIDLTKISKEQSNHDVNQESATGENYRYSTKDFSVQASHKFTPEEVKKFVEDYNAKLGVPLYETGFVPITTKPNHLITQPIIPNTYKSNLKVNMTPGLKHYASRTNKNFKRNKYESLLLGQQHLLPIFYTTGPLTEDVHRNGYKKFHRSIPNRHQFVRNAKHIRFIH